MTERDEHLHEELSEQEIDLIARVQRDSWNRGEQITVEQLLDQYPVLNRHDDALLDLIYSEFLIREQAGLNPETREFVDRFPNHESALRTLFEVHVTLESESNVLASDDSHAPSSGSSISASLRDQGPQRIARYRLIRPLGQGSFGTVHLAQDDDLDRLVAIKIPHEGIIRKPADVERFLSEARAYAKLKHKGIVTIHDVGEYDSSCYVVLEYVAGLTLSRYMKTHRPSNQNVVEIMVQIALAIHHVHINSLVHRDLKPSNIIVDDDGQPHITDFGLAVQLPVPPAMIKQVAGTIQYMAPEQLRGESHRVDARSDIWSLGIIFFEMLTHQRPFNGELPNFAGEVFTAAPPEPISIDSTIDRELNRICLKCLSLKMSQRYHSAELLAADLSSWLKDHQTRQRSEVDTGTSVAAGASDFSEIGAPSVSSKGLRSFEMSDADFFLQLLPGSRYREGMPESIHFWMNWIDHRVVEPSSSVGLIYGPSGSGKSSFVKAGLIPKLDSAVRVIHVDAKPTGTELLLAATVRDRCQLEGVSLNSVLAGCRDQPAETLIVIDQFE